ncbi:MULTISPECIES: hypothetical protein [unclassified Virgibacillus]|uniref:hypothetical protein n=1 Tax=unclassified Virgibacillus TaxID=2620237 RepID=UPI0024DE8C5B|nr:hypothetical protein [Virgibacillus sp. LDC-1]
MRGFVFFTVIITSFSLLYKWRYRLLNTLLAIGLIRRIAVSFALQPSALKNKIIPALFQTNGKKEIH